MRIYNALVENPYYLRTYDYRYGIDINILDIAVKQCQKQWIEMNVIIDNNGLVYPYFNRPFMTTFLFGTRYKRLVETNL